MNRADEALQTRPPRRRDIEVLDRVEHVAVEQLGVEARGL
jgi:hypothetical protein